MRKLVVWVYAAAWKSMYGNPASCSVFHQLLSIPLKDIWSENINFWAWLQTTWSRYSLLATTVCVVSFLFLSYQP